ncbi:hypothetical protein PSCICF_43370 [Pseudomonas cichorii]|nr:hypothetical protein PSCICF_43370 [Pseudomonas cichorii]
MASWREVSAWRKAGRTTSMGKEIMGAPEQAADYKPSGHLQKLDGYCLVAGKPRPQWSPPFRSQGQRE